MMCNLQLVVLLAIVAVRYGATYTNPVLQNVKQGKVLMYENLYYMVAKDDQDNGTNWFPIYSSADLESWVRISYAFNDKTKPNWASTDKLTDPFIHYEGEYFYLLYGAQHSSSLEYRIGAAKSRSIEGPYVAEPRPLVLPIIGEAYYPHLVVDNENKDTYLLWTAGNSQTINGQQIYLEDYTFAGIYPEIVLKATWEGFTETQNSVYRNGYYYIFYTGGNFCTSNASIVVARSTSPLGPYEKLGNPVINATAAVPSVIKGPDGSSDAILYQASCDPPTFTNVSTLVWSSDNWPAVVSP